MDEATEQAAAKKRLMEAMRAAGSFTSSDRLDADIASLKTELESELNDLAHALATDAPILASPGLVRSALAPLEELIDRKTRSARSVFDHLFKVLPERLFDEPPQPKVHPTEEQRRFYINKLHRILDSFAVEDQGAPPLLASLDPARARRLRERFLGLDTSLAILRQDRARRLKEVSRKRQKLEEMKAQRREIEFGSAEQVERYRRIEGDHDKLTIKTGHLEKDMEQIDRKIAETNRKETEANGRLKSLECQNNVASNNRTLQIAISIRESFVDYKVRNREARRGRNYSPPVPGVVLLRLGFSDVGGRCGMPVRCPAP
ncbi:MAG: hypothetical protein H7840_04175 [Alphaproteobacteria bacterium]